MSKLIVRKVRRFWILIFQTMYRNVATKERLALNLGDIHDPLFGTMSGTAVDRVLIHHELESAAHRYCSRVSGDTLRGLEFGTINYLRDPFKIADRTVFEYEANTRPHRVSPTKVTGDLTTSDTDVIGVFDLVVATQLLTFVRDDAQAISTISQMLKPGGTLFGTEPFLCPISVFDDTRWGEHRRYTPRSLKTLIDSRFKLLELKLLGNAVTSAAMILGVPAEDLDQLSLGVHRPSHATTIYYVAERVD